MSWKPEVTTGTDPKFYDNALRFATYAEALQSASELSRRWLLVRDYRAVESDEPVNFTYVDGELTAVKAVAA